MLPGQINFKVLGALVVAIALSAPADASAETLTFSGTGGALGMMNILGAAFAEANPGVTVDVLPSLGSGGGIKAVLAGAIDLGLSALLVKTSSGRTCRRIFQHRVRSETR